MKQRMIDENCPDWLPREGKQMWREVLPILAEKPWWNPVAGPAILTAYCHQVARLAQLDLQLRKSGYTMKDRNGCVMRNPLLDDLEAAVELLHKSADALGVG